MCLFTIALEIAKAHHQDLQVVGPCQRSIQRECMSVLLYLYVIYISFHIHSLSSLNCCITSGLSRQEVMGQVLFSYINLTTVLWAVSSFFSPNAYNSAEKCNVFIYGSSRYKSNIILLRILIALLPLKCCNTDSTSVMSGAYTCCVNSWILDTFTQHMSPTLNASYALQRFERGNATCNRMMFDFYLGLPHIHLFTHSL